MSKLEKLTRETVTLRVLLISVIVLGIGLALWWMHTKIIEPWSILLRALAEAVLIAGFVGIIYELLIRRRFEEEMEYSVLQAINADAGLLKGKKLKNEAVDSIIKNCLEAKLCDQEMAKIFYDGLISPYINIESFRRNFEYEIKLFKLDSDITANGITFSKDSYFKVIEELSYTKRLSIKKDMEFVVGVCLNDPQLNNYKGKDCIYRTIFRLKESEKAILQTTAPPENIFKITIKINNKELTPVMTSYDDNKGIKIICKYEGEEINASKENEFEIKVVTLHNRDIDYYTAYIYDPSFSPRVKLHYNDEMKDIFAVTHFTTSKGKDIIPKPDKDAKYILVEGKDEWIFPTSGVIFIWKVCKKEGASL